MQKYKVVSRVYTRPAYRVVVGEPIPCGPHMQEGSWDRGTHDEYVNVFDSFIEAKEFKRDIEEG